MAEQNVNQSLAATDFGAIQDLSETSPADPTGPRFLVEKIFPSVDDGRYPIKRIAGEPVEVWADVLREGHDTLAAALLWRKETASAWQREPMRLHTNDRWHGSFTPPEPGRYLYAVEAWTDQFSTWRHGLLLKQQAGLDVALEAREGREMLDDLQPRQAGARWAIERARSEFDRTADLNVLLERRNQARLFRRASRAAISPAAPPCRSRLTGRERAPAHGMRWCRVARAPCRAAMARSTTASRGFPISPSSASTSCT